jgi:alkylation response protein AidB-like acyl-CoA dehydrogenase
MVDLVADDTPALRAWRGEVRAFLDEALPGGMVFDYDYDEDEAGWAEYLAFWRKVGQKGWIGLTWPRQYYGQERSAIEKWVLYEEFANRSATYGVIGLAVAGSLLRLGTHEQRLKHLKGIAEGTVIWGEGYTEPGAGSDLASLQLRAEADGDAPDGHYVLNGSKIWTTHAHFANRMFLLVRTRFDGKPQAGITFLLLDMATPGLTVKPIVTLAGEHEVNQVFFDNVRAPMSGRLGEENAGWTVAKYLLEFERGGGSAAGLQVSLKRLRAMAQAEPSDAGAPLLDDPAFRARLAAEEIAVTAIEMTEHRVMSALAAGHNPGPASSMLKTQGTEAMQRIDELAIEVAGHYAAVYQPEARAAGSNTPAVGPDHSLIAMARYLNNRAGSIYGGSNEIQRDIMARLVLGL